MEIFTQSARQTQKLGEKLAADLTSGKQVSRVLCLYGNLGSGKTTFVQGLAKGLGIKKRILSPTFIMMRQYGNFYHVDLYRAENEKGIEGLGLSEIWSDHANIIAIEWPEKIEKILPVDCLKIKFDYIDENRRKITFTGS